MPTHPGARGTGAPRAVVAGVALIAFAGLLYEVLLTRIFSVTLWYHFGFLAISLAMLGTAASAVLCFLFPEALAGTRHRRNLGASALVFAVCAPSVVAFHLSMRLPSYETPLAFYAVFGAQLGLFFVAFFFAGLCIAIALFRYAARVGVVYAFDLVGASLGSFLVVPLLYRASPLALVFLVSAAACGAAAFFWRAGAAARGAPTAAGIAGLACLGLAVANDGLGLLEVSTIKAYASGHFQQTEGRKLLELWSPVSRLAVLAPSNRNPQTLDGLFVTNDAGAPTVLRRFDGDYANLADLVRDPIPSSSP